MPLNRIIRATGERASENPPHRTEKNPGRRILLPKPARKPSGSSMTRWEPRQSASDNFRTSLPRRTHAVAAFRQIEPTLCIRRASDVRARERLDVVGFDSQFLSGEGGRVQNAALSSGLHDSSLEG